MSSSEGGGLTAPFAFTYLKMLLRSDRLAIMQNREGNSAFSHNLAYPVPSQEVGFLLNEEIREVLGRRRNRVIWAAGFIDGEGHIGIHKANQRWFGIMLRVSNTHEASILELQEIFGGNVFKREREGRKDAWIWHLTSAQAADALAELLPYLVTKKDQANLALIHQSSRLHKGYKQSNAQKAVDLSNFKKMRELNAR